MICDEEGADPNVNTGDLIPVDYVEDYLGGTLTETITPGIDDEEEEEYRTRVLESYGTKAFGGNKADYRSFIDALDNVGGCKPKRREADSPWITIYLLNSAHNVPSAEIVAAVQDAVDPEVSHGEGDGMAPICHHVQIIAATGVTVNIATTLTLDEGYTVESVKDSVESEINAYLLSLRRNWENNELSSTYVRIAQIESRILAVQGVLDVADTEINGEAENLVLTFEKVPILGEVTISV